MKIRSLFCLMACLTLGGSFSAFAQAGGVEDPSIGSLRFGEFIPLSINAGRSNRSAIVEFPWIIFEQVKGENWARLRLRLLSHPKGRWQVTVQLLDPEDDELKTAEAVFENSGRISSFAAAGEGDLALNFGPAGDSSKASRFRVKVAPALEDARITHKTVAHDSPARREYSGTLHFQKIMPVLLNAGLFAYGNTVEAPWIRFQKEEDRIQAALRVTLLSYPKSKWRATVQLLDRDNREIQVGMAVFENSGRIKGAPVKDEGDVLLDLRSADALSGATRFRVRIELARENAKVTTRLVSLPRRGKQPTGNRSIDLATVVGDCRAPAKATTTVWRKVDTAPEPDPLSVSSDRPIYWETDGEIYVPYHGYGGSSFSTEARTIDGLPEGRFRVTISSTEGSDGTPFGASAAIDLTGDNLRQKATVQLTGRYPLTVKVVHEQTGRPMPGERIILRAPSGLPIALRSYTGDDGVMQFSALAAGTYALEVGKQGWWGGKLKTVAVQVKPEPGNTIVVPYDGSFPKP